MCQFWWDGGAVKGLEGVWDGDESISKVRGIRVIPLSRSVGKLDTLNRNDSAVISFLSLLLSLSPSLSLSFCLLLSLLYTYMYSFYVIILFLSFDLWFPSFAMK